MFKIIFFLENIGKKGIQTNVYSGFFYYNENVYISGLVTISRSRTCVCLPVARLTEIQFKKLPINFEYLNCAGYRAQFFDFVFNLNV